MPNFNAFMHRRNIFRKEPDFKRLACDYQELKPFMTVGSKNKLKFDFKNPDALRALTCALLHRYFQKRITLPPDRMIPAVPQRLNYICWVEDLVKLVEIQQADVKVVGMDIGTGASCIFPILSCHRNPTWSFIGVEADAKSYSIALENVRKNFMEDRIHMVKITTEDTLTNILCGNWMLSSDPLTFIMCNPPFFEEEYGVTLEINPTNCSSSSGTSTSSICGGGSRPKSSSNTSEKIESVVSGGEIAFVGHMLEESRHLRSEVSIYTSMLGKKQSLIHFKQTLSSLNEENLSWTWAELCQGKTIRYAIAWTFKPGLDLQRAPPLRHGKNKSWKFKLLRKMPKKDGQLELLENSEFLKNLITRELLIAKARVTKQNPQSFEMLIKTNDRTWSNQRRKRREHTNKHKHQATSSSINYANSSALNTNQISPQSSISLSANNNDPCNDTSTQMVCDSDSSTTKDVPPTIAHEGSTSHHAPSTITFTLDNLGNRIMQDINSELLSQESPSTTNNNNSLASSITQQTNMILNNQQLHQGCAAGTAQIGNQQQLITNMAPLVISSKKRKNPSSCSSSPSRVCPSPNDELTDDDNQSTDNTDYDDRNDDAMNDIVEIKRICIKEDTDDCENMDDIYDYLLCCRISLTRVCHDLYFELKLEHPCTAANEAYDLFQYFRNKLSEK